MRRLRKTLAFASIAFLLCPLPVLASETWTEVHSPHFSVVTNAGEKRGREIALRFEQMRSVFGQLMVKNKVNIPVPLQIIAFRNTKELRQHGPMFNRKAVEVAGFYQHAQDQDYILLDTSGTEDRWTTVFHEYAHLLLNGNFPPTDAWFDEGFAEYFSTLDISGSDVQLGKPPMGDMELLHSSRWIPTADVLQVQHDSATYNVGSARNLFYAQSWVLVHYLFDMQRMPQTGKYFDLYLDKHTPMENALQQAFGMSPKQLEHAVQDYYVSPKAVYRRYKLPINLEPMNSYTAKAITPLDAQAILGDFDLHTMDHRDQGTAILQAVLQQQPANGTAHRGLGFAYLYKNQYDQAAEHFARAAELSSSDPWVHYYAAMLLLRRGGQLSVGDEAEKIKLELKTAVTLNPQFADAYNALGVAEMQSGEIKQALVDLSTAVSQSPRNETYIGNLGLAYIHDRNWDEAAKLFEKVKNSSNPQIASMATHNLEQLELMKNPVRAFPSSAPGVAAGNSFSSEAGGSTAPTDPPPMTIAPDPGGVLFLKGTLVAVECSSAAATLTVQSEGKTWKMLTSDYKHLILIGGDEFSCGWHDRKVAINYHKTQSDAGDLVSLELQ
jgi:tetratricopeptide (TPR) repeat protein